MLNLLTKLFINLKNEYSFRIFLLNILFKAVIFSSVLVLQQLKHLARN
jgi:hypothetical protein